MFLPDDYKSPSSSKNYMKILDGENRLRILSPAIFGWQDWTLDKKPVRFRKENKPLNPIDPNKPIRYFWAFVVFNYAEETVQILEITQATIRKAIESLVRDSDWGAPFHYDIKITRKGQQTDTEYVVTPSPKKPTDPYIIQEFKNKPCWLEALYQGNDPFDQGWTMRTSGYFEQGATDKKLPNHNGVDYISELQVKNIRDLIFEDSNVDEALNSLLKRCRCTELESITVDKYDQAYAWVKKRIDDLKARDDLPF